MCHMPTACTLPFSSSLLLRLHSHMFAVGQICDRVVPLHLQPCACGCMLDQGRRPLALGAT